MQATRVLRDEHALIEKVLDQLDERLDRLASHDDWSWPFAEWIVKFISQFADGTHHAKEEEVLFPRLELRGIPRDGGPIGCMLHEHEIGRQCVAAMRKAIAGHDSHAFALAATEYRNLLRRHIFKENNVLFLMAERCLTPQDDQAICSSYTAAETARTDLPGAAEFAAELAAWGQGH